MDSSSVTTHGIVSPSSRIGLTPRMFDNEIVPLLHNNFKIFKVVPASIFSISLPFAYIST